MSSEHSQLFTGNDVQVQFLDNWGPHNKGEILDGMLTELCEEMNCASIFTPHGKQIIPLQNVAINIKKEQHSNLAYTQVEKLKKGQIVSIPVINGPDHPSINSWFTSLKNIKTDAQVEDIFGRKWRVGVIRDFKVELEKIGKKRKRVSEKDSRWRTHLQETGKKMRDSGWSGPQCEIWKKAAESYKKEEGYDSDQPIASVRNHVQSDSVQSDSVQLNSVHQSDSVQLSSGVHQSDSVESESVQLNSVVNQSDSVESNSIQFGFIQSDSV